MLYTQLWLKWSKSVFTPKDYELAQKFIQNRDFNSLYELVKSERLKSKKWLSLSEDKAGPLTLFEGELANYLQLLGETDILGQDEEYYSEDFEEEY